MSSVNCICYESATSHQGFALASRPLCLAELPVERASFACSNYRTPAVQQGGMAQLSTLQLALFSSDASLAGKRSDCRKNKS